MTLVPGTTLGRYEILEPLGQGGMATVYKARQPSLHRTVALKVIRPAFAEDAGFRERFDREARAIAQLAHPNIVQVFDYDKIGERAFLVMQYLEGGTLKDRVLALAGDGKRLDQLEIARIVEQVGAGLAYAHDLGIVHRDMKPSNVMLTRDGRAIVTDFGIAKIMGDGAQQTQTGVGIGTPDYMSPEQGQGLTLDGRSDIYALAVMAYELLAGRPPFTADTPFALVLKHVRDAVPPPSQFDPAVGPATERVLLKGLAKEPAGRYGKATEFAEALREAIVEDRSEAAATVVGPTSAETVIPPAAARQRVPRLVLGAVVAAALIVAGGGAVVSGVFSTTTAVPAVAVSAPPSTSSPAITTPTSTTAPTPTTAPSPTASPAATTPPPTPIASPTPLPVTASLAPATVTPAVVTLTATPAPTIRAGTSACSPPSGNWGTSFSCTFFGLPPRQAATIAFQLQGSQPFTYNVPSTFPVGADGTLPFSFRPCDFQSPAGSYRIVATSGSTSTGAAVTIAAGGC